MTTKTKWRKIQTEIKANKLTREEIAQKYGYKDAKSLQSMLYIMKRKAKAKNAAKYADKKETTAVKKTETSPKEVKTVVSTMRTISFPDGFKIEIERSLVNGMLIDALLACPHRNFWLQKVNKSKVRSQNFVYIHRIASNKGCVYR